MSLRTFLASVSFGLCFWMTASFFHKPTLLLPLNHPGAAVAEADVEESNEKGLDLEPSKEELTSL